MEMDGEVTWDLYHLEVILEAIMEMQGEVLGVEGLDIILGLIMEMGGEITSDLSDLEVIILGILPH